MSTRNHEASLQSERPVWKSDSVCAQTGPEAFFPEVGESTRDAKMDCSGCGAKQVCLDYALENDTNPGVWGGYSEREILEIKNHVAGVALVGY